MTARIAMVFMAYLLALAASGAHACELEAGTRAVVIRVESAETLVLHGGETVVLAGALAPQSGPTNDDAWPPRQTTRAELERLAAGKTVDIATTGRRFDRYGRLIAQVFIAADAGAERQWLQGELIAAGLSRAYALHGTSACLDEMLALEQAARADRRGHWASSVFEDRDVGNDRLLRSLRDTFQSVEGIVDRVETVRGQPSLVFASRGEGNGFRATLAAAGKQEGSRSPSSRKFIESLAGARVRVRGWIEPRQRPFIVLSDPRLIEIIAAAPVVSDAAKGLPPARESTLPAPIPAADQN